MEMQLELKALQEQVGITFIYVTHDQEEALTMSDRIAVMTKGVVLQIGSPLEIYERPNCRFVADFIGETNFIPGTVISVEDGQARFEADSLHMLASASDVRAGMQATLAVRPERVRLSAEKPDDTPNAFLGGVSETIYIGTDTHFQVNLTPTVNLRIRRQNTIPIGMPAMTGASGTKVWVSWQPESARVLVE